MKKLLIPILLILAIVAAYWVAYGNPFKKIFGGSATEEKPDTSATSQTSTGSKTNGSFIQEATVTKDTRGFPLSQGSTGQYVSMIQTALNERYGSELVVDGILGSKTVKALSAHGFNPEAIYYKHFNAIVGYTYWT
jgi:lysozyme family protein